MKSNKGITLIALVVTIIILLILAGVSITTLSGNGLFGRAESSAAKYQAASEAENSTISSMLDKYDHYESQTSEMVTIKWTSPIATNGIFMNDTTPEDYVRSSYHDKEIVAIKPDGTRQAINPYQTVNMQLPVGTTLRFYLYWVEDAELTRGFVGLNSDVQGVNRELGYIEATLNKKGTAEFELWNDDYYEASNGQQYYSWDIECEYLGGVPK